MATLYCFGPTASSEPRTLAAILGPTTVHIRSPPLFVTPDWRLQASSDIAPCLYNHPSPPGTIAPAATLLEISSFIHRPPEAWRHLVACRSGFPYLVEAVSTWSLHYLSLSWLPLQCWVILISLGPLRCGAHPAIHYR